MRPKFKGSGTAHQNLLVWWPMTEFVGNRHDLFHRATLTQNGTVSSVADGPLDRAAEFVSSATNYLETPDNAAWPDGNVDWSLGFWARWDSKAAHICAATKYVSAGNQRSWYANYNFSTDRMQFLVFPNGTTTYTLVVADTFGAISTGTWYWVCCYHDGTNDLIGISINGGAYDTAAHSTGVYNGTAALQIGRNEGNQPWNGDIGPTGIWGGKILTAAENTAIYGAGVGANVGRLQGVRGF